MDLRNMAMLAMSAMLTCGFPDGHPALASKTLDENGKRPKHSAKQTTPTSPNNGYGGRLSANTQAFMTKCKLTHPPKSPNKNVSISILGNWRNSIEYIEWITEVMFTLLLMAFNLIPKKLPGLSLLCGGFLVPKLTARHGKKIWSDGVVGIVRLWRDVLVLSLQGPTSTGNKTRNGVFFRSDRKTPWIGQLVL